ncbi:MAG: hypothetical protein IKO10_15325, partial [Lachnospiraceae bacterium]|nr:hypothetical protein [Lachnospiraceae bacterium]
LLACLLERGESRHTCQPLSVNISMIILRLLWCEKIKHILSGDIVKFHHLRNDIFIRRTIKPLSFYRFCNFFSLITFLHRFTHIDTSRFLFKLKIQLSSFF